EGEEGPEQVEHRRGDERRGDGYRLLSAASDLQPEAVPEERVSVASEEPGEGGHEHGEGRLPGKRRTADVSALEELADDEGVIGDAELLRAVRAVRVDVVLVLDADEDEAVLEEVQGGGPGPALVDLVEGERLERVLSVAQGDAQVAVPHGDLLD